MSDDMKRHADMFRAMAQMVEILAPFNEDDRLKAIIATASFCVSREYLLKSIPAVDELIESANRGK